GPTGRAGAAGRRGLGLAHGQLAPGAAGRAVPRERARLRADRPPRRAARRAAGQPVPRRRLGRRGLARDTGRCRVALLRRRPRELIAQEPLQYLARRVARDHVDEGDRLGLLEARELAVAPLEHLALGQRVVLLHHDRERRLAPFRAGLSDHRDLADLRAAEDHVFDLGRVHVLAAGDHHVLHPVLDVDEALLVDGGDVARVEPAVLDRLGRRLGALPVLLHDVLAADDHLALLAGRDALAVVVDHA